MQYVLLLLVGLVLALAPIDASLDVLQNGTFISRVDHFSPEDRREFRMVYVANREHHDATNGPIFIQIQEGDHSTTEFLRSGLMYDIAVQQRAALITFDLRYFRSNLPTHNASTINLRHLTVEQILYDIRALIDTVRPPTTSNQSIILWGSGLGANLAVWTHRRFPGLVAGVWSSSGVHRPVLHTSLPYEHLAERIGAVGGAECQRRLGDAFESLAIYMAFEAEDLVMYFYDLCNTPNVQYNGEISAVYAGIVQIIIEQINARHTAAIDELCGTLNAIDEEGVLHAAFVALGEWVQSTRADGHCTDVSFNNRRRINASPLWPSVQQNSWAAGVQLSWPHMSRSQMYLSCTQLGRALTTVNSPANSTFGHQIGQDLFFGHCNILNDAEGNFEYARLAGEIFELWRRLDGNAAQVVYTSGDLDAWHPFRRSLLEPGVVVIAIPNYGKSADLYSIRPEDSAELVAAKQHITRLIQKWIGAKQERE